MPHRLARYFASTLAVAFLSVAGFPAHAANQSSAPSCLAKAKTELAIKSPNAERDALACLIDAVAALDERQRSFEEGKQGSGVLTAPTHYDRNQQAR